jgi:alpha-N-arabinofuranosidase
MDDLISKHSAIMDKYDPDKRVGLVVDEWGDWYDPEPGTNPGFLYQQNTLRDAIVAGVNLDIFHKHCDRVAMTNIAQMINVLQSMILTDKGKMVLTPTYYVFKMYKVHQGATFIPLELNAPEYKVESTAVPSLHATASRDSTGKLHLSIVNLDPNRAATVSAKINGMTAKSVAGTILTSEKMNAMNTFDSPESIKPAEFKGAQVDGEKMTLNLPAKSVVVLEIQ